VFNFWNKNLIQTHNGHFAVIFLDRFQVVGSLEYIIIVRELRIMGPYSKKVIKKISFYSRAEEVLEVHRDVLSHKKITSSPVRFLPFIFVAKPGIIAYVVPGGHICGRLSDLLC
jgi:hypothetical protein